MIGDATLTGRMIQTMTEEVLLMEKYFITFRLIPIPALRQPLNTMLSLIVRGIVMLFRQLRIS